MRQISVNELICHLDAYNNLINIGNY